MHKRASFAVPILLLLAAGRPPRPAAADDAADERQRAARMAVRQFAAANADAAHGFYTRFDDDPAVCRAAVADGNAAGLKAFDTIDTSDGEVSWKTAGAICDAYARLQPMQAAVDAVAPPYNTIVIIRGVNGEGIEHMAGDAYRANVAVAKDCVKLVDAALAAKAPADAGFAPNQNEHDTLVTLAEVRAQCTDFIAWGAKAGTAADDAVAAEQAKVRAKYAKQGITGDRLKYLMDADNRYVMGKGCKTLEMAGKKKAAVLYEMQEGDTYWVVYKMAFKGDRLVKTTERRFNKATSNGWSCK